MGDFFNLSSEVITAVIIAVLIAPIMWWKWKRPGNVVTKALRDASHGLRTEADRKEMRHDTGIGTRDVLVMRPAKLGFGIYFGLLFFGGGAAFFALVVLQSPDVTGEDWWIFVGLMAFTLCAILLMIANRTRIHLDAASVEKRPLLLPRKSIRFSEITQISPHGKDYRLGVKFSTQDGKSMRVVAGFSGYLQLLERLPKLDERLGILLKMSAQSSQRLF